MFTKTYKKHRKSADWHPKALHQTQADAMEVVVDRNDVPSSRPRRGALITRLQGFGLRVEYLGRVSKIKETLNLKT